MTDLALFHRPLKMSKRLLLLAFSLVFFTMLTVACTNTYDWRIVKSDENAYEALYPSKPTRAEKTLIIGDQKYVMTMEAASAGKALFAVGVITLDAGTQNTDEILEWLQKNTLRNLKTDQQPEIQKNLSFKVAGSKTEKIPADGVKIYGWGPDKIPRIFWVRWLKRTDNSGIQRLYQVSVMQTLEKALEQKYLNQLEEQYETFYAGFQPY